MIGRIIRFFRRCPPVEEWDKVPGSLEATGCVVPNYVWPVREYRLQVVCPVCGERSLQRGFALFGEQGAVDSDGWPLGPDGERLPAYYSGR